MLFLICIFCSLFEILKGDQIPTVVLPDGTTLTGVQEGSVAVFRGVRFAQPPVGNLRWAPPVPWVNNSTNVVVDASQFGSTCKQFLWGNDGLLSPDHGSEDCLFLNIFVDTTTISSWESKSVPVGIFVHGGSYITGSGSIPLYDGSNLVDFWKGNGIIVTTNYRLNIFGFLGSDELRSRDVERGSTGNYGIQDQRLAFGWVRDNIAAFGGDQHKVTIFGQSAGAGSMSNHLVMPQSWGLFHQVIIESGAFGLGSSQNMSCAEQTFQNLLSAAECGDVDCLLGLSEDEVFEIGLNLPATDPFAHSSAFSPTADGVELTTHPWIALANGAVADVPTVLGSTSDEGTLFTIVPHSIGQTELDAYWHHKQGYSAAEIAKLNALYVQNCSYPACHASVYWWAAERSKGDNRYSCPAKYTAQQLSKLATAGARTNPAYMYFFSHHPREATVTRHVADLQYVFHQTALLNHPEDAAMADSMATYWGNFINGGSPSAPVYPTEVPLWSPYVLEEDNCNIIADADDIAMKPGLKLAECEFHIDRIDKIVRSTYPST